MAQSNTINIIDNGVRASYNTRLHDINNNIYFYTLFNTFLHSF